MKLNYFLILVLVGSVVLSCKPSNPDALKPQPSGAPGDLVVVMNNSHWQSEAGDTLIKVLTRPIDALPSPEPMFNVIHCTHSSFGPSFKSQRNIIITKIGRDQPEPKILVQKAPFSKTQIVISILAPTREDFIALVDTSRDNLVSLINEVERKRLTSVNEKKINSKISEVLANKHHISLSVPDAYKLDMQQTDFVWLSHEYRDIIQGIFIYTYDYTDELTFTRDFLVEKRNEILREYVPGELAGSYMTTEPLYPPLFFEYRLEGRYTAEMRGLWRVEEGLIMGGPFMSITQLDERRNRVITVDGFVFAPAYKKREYLRQIEAVVLSLDIINDQEIIN